MPHTHQASNFHYCPHRQRGAVLMIMLVIMVMGAATVLVGSLSSSGLRIERDKITADALAQAKDALIGYAFNVSSAVRRPGNLPYQDRLVPSEEPSTTNIPNYDGDEDGCPTTLPPPACLGRLPWRDLDMAISAPSENDPTGFMPWYAFSRNLERGEPINSELLNVATKPWLTVRDMNGNVLSNRVAFIIFIPGLALPGQSRPSSPNLGGASQYLDSITVPAGCTAPCVPGNYSNRGATNEFIVGDKHRWINDPDNPGKQIEDQSYYFNDKLIYVTIDDLMPMIVKRVAGEARSVLNVYYGAKNQFPDAALLGSSGTYNPVAGNNSGMLPIDLGACSCTDTDGTIETTSCSCNFNLIASAAFRRETSTWSATNVSGACTRTSERVCTCTGAGFCKNASGFINFTCDSSGNCAHNTGNSKFIFTPASYSSTVPSIPTPNGCSLVGSNVECTSSGSFDVNLKLPSWFTDNLWQDYFYYHRSNTSSLLAGTQGSIKALVIGAGARITSAPFASKNSPQSRPSSNINDYLDSAENTNGDLLFEATNKPLSSSYNDQVFIVAP